MRIVLTDRATVTNGDVDTGVFEKYGECLSYELTPNELIAERLEGADAVLCNKTVLSAAVLERCPSVKYIGLFATGYNNIDVDYCRAHGICVCNAGSYSTQAVAQHVFAMLLAIYSKIPEYSGFCVNGGWIRSKTFSAFTLGQHELFNKTIGIVGFGSIGAAVARIAEAFDMKILACTRTPKQSDIAEFVGFDELLARSDIVSVHCPLTPATQLMFNADAFSLMKDGSVFINSSRGGVVDEKALCEALSSGKLAAAAVDVLTKEPMDASSPLFGAPNLLITPHVAWAPIETRERLMKIVCDNLEAWLRGEPTNVVS